MKKRYMLFIILLLAFLVLALFILKSKPISDKECEKDTDCIKRQVSCCSCNMGGQEKCINKNNSSVEEKLKNCQKDIICSAVYNCRDFSCSCQNNKCVET